MIRVITRVVGMIGMLSTARKRAAQQSVMLSAMLLLLTACPAPGPECVYADDWGQLQRITVTIDPTKPYTDSGISLMRGTPLYIQTSGLVDLCPENTTLSPTFPPANTIRPDVEAWQDSGIDIQTNAPFQIIPTGSYKDITQTNKTEGKGLYALVFESGYNPNTSTDTTTGRGFNDHFWWPNPTGAADAKTINSYPYFFELFDNKSVGDAVGGFSGVVNQVASHTGGPKAGATGGRLWFKYARSADAQGMDIDGDSRYSPWFGRYAWEESRCIACMHTVIIGSCAPLWSIPFVGAAAFAACVAGWEGGCADSGHLEGLNNKCVEHYSGDHWVQENYSGPGGNSGGYSINVSMGCPGVKGQFLKAEFPTDQEIITTYVDHYHYENTGEDCPAPAAGVQPPLHGCVPVRDVNGVIERIPSYSLRSPVAQAMSLDRALNADINTSGEFGTRNFNDTLLVKNAPFGGPLWFHVVDDKIKLSDTVGLPSSCAIPSGCLVTPRAGSSTPVCTNVGRCTPPDISVCRANGPACTSGQVLHCVGTSCSCVSSTQSSCDIGEVLTCSGSTWNSLTNNWVANTGTPACLPNSGFHVPWGVHYDDNIGSYKVRVVAIKPDDRFSSVLTAIIKPIKELLFGVCRPNHSLNQAACQALYPPSILTPLSSCVPLGTTSTLNCVASTLPTCISGAPVCVDASLFTSGGWLDGLAERLFNQLVGTSAGGGNAFINTLRAVLVLYIIIYGMMFMLGMIQDVQTDFVGRVFRLSIVGALLAPGSWEFFYNHLFIFFIEGMDDFISMLSSQFMSVGAATVGFLSDPVTGLPVLDAAGNPVPLGDGSDPFAFVNQTLGKFFSIETMVKIAGLLFASPIGWLYIIFIFYGMYFYMHAVLKALVVYLLAMIAIAVLLAVAPIFLTLMLFKRTKELFDSWWRQLVSNLFQPVLVFTVLSIFNIFVYNSLYLLLHYSVCWDCVLEVNIDPVVLPKISFCLFKWYMPWGGDFAMGGAGNVPIGFFLILIFIIICSAMSMLADWACVVVSNIVTGVLATSLDPAAKMTIGKSKDIAAGVLSASAGVVKTVVSKGAKAASGAIKGKREGGPQQ